MTKRLFSALFLIFMLGTLTDAFALTRHFTRDLKCPRCKMKIEKKNGCPCHKKTPTRSAVIHDPCGDDEGDFHIQFDRILGMLVSTQTLPLRFKAVYAIHPPTKLMSLMSDIPHPPPQT